MHADNFILSPDLHISYGSLMLGTCTCKYTFYNLIVLARCYNKSDFILCLFRHSVGPSLGLLDVFGVEKFELMVLNNCASTLQMSSLRISTTNVSLFGNR